jgi:putative endonuclease
MSSTGINRHPGLDPGPLASAKPVTMEKGGFTFILTNRAHGVLYIGVTADIDARLWQHRNGQGSAFCRRYGLDRLVLVEGYLTIEEAIRREKQLKNWQRAWKIELIEASNPEWLDLGRREAELAPHQAASGPGSSPG